MLENINDEGKDIIEKLSDDANDIVEDIHDDGEDIIEDILEVNFDDFTQLYNFHTVLFVIGLLLWLPKT